MLRSSSSADQARRAEEIFCMFFFSVDESSMGFIEMERKKLEGKFVRRAGENVNMGRVF